jgi:branched-chain amino acid transport system substrate-binding protein
MIRAKFRQVALSTAAAIAALGLALGFGGGPVQAEDVITVGAIQPLAGDCAQWGIPITRGVEIWADQLNEEGGLLAGDGKRYRIEVKSYDNVCYVPGEDLKAARRAVLDDKIKFLLQTFTPGSRQATAQLLTENQALATSYGAGYLSKEYPFTLGGITGSPHSYMLIVSRILEANPEAKRVAIITSNTSFGLAAKAYYEAGVAPYKDRGVEIVYNESYDPAATTDMLGLVTPMMAWNPDVIVELGFVPAQQATMMETVTQLGFKGVFGAEGFTMPLILERMQASDIAGRLYSGYAVEASEASFSPRAHDFYQRYIKQYGEAQWSPFAPIGYAAMGTIEAGLKMSSSIDSKTVTETLYAAEVVDHPIFGPSRWGGEDIYGANHHLLTPLPIYNVDAEGKVILDAVVDSAKWWEDHKDVALPVLGAGGQVYAK